MGHPDFFEDKDEDDRAEPSKVNWFKENGLKVIDIEAGFRAIIIKVANI